MPYEILTKETIVDYLKKTESMRKFFSSFDALDIEEVGDGNLNFVYKITNQKQPTETVVLKQAVPYLRCAGETWPLSKERMNFEIMALETHKELHPEGIPDIYHHDKEMSLVIMRNLNRHKILRGEMNQGKIFPQLADHISTFLARTIFRTSDWYLGSHDKKESVKQFINKELCELTENFIFTHPFYNASSNSYSPDLTPEDINYIHKDGRVRIAVAELRHRFKTGAECLVHGDLHTGRIMVNETDTYMIDPEFAFYGPAGFDPGLFIGNLLLAYVAHGYRQEELLKRDPLPYRTWILDTIVQTWEQFVTKFNALWEAHIIASQDPFWHYEGALADHEKLRQNTIDGIFRDAVGFAGCEMVRRTLGIAKVSDVKEIEDTEARAELERLSLQIGKELITDRQQIKSIQEVIDIATRVSPLTTTPVASVKCC